MRNDLSGKTINMWEVLSVHSCGTNQSTKYLCRCLGCGDEHVIAGYTITSGKSKMCRKCSSKRCQHRKYTGDPIRNILSGMLQRCYNENSASYQDYGGRGIRVFDDWHNNHESFYDWAYSNGYERGLTIERVDVNGDYTPENCIFIPKADQSKNRRNTYQITISGETRCLHEWCQIYHVCHGTAVKLHNAGMDWVDIFELKRNTSECGL